MQKYLLALALVLPIATPQSRADDEHTGKSAGEEKLLVDGPALLRSWVPPESPPGIADKEPHVVRVRFIVDDDGKVRSARPLDGDSPPFSDLAVAAVKQWVFAPALENGKAIASCYDVSVSFSPSNGKGRKTRPSAPAADEQPELAPTTTAVAKTTPEGDYPEVLARRKIPGAVRFHAVVSVDGRVRRPGIVASTHADFVLPALRALEQWEFTPAMQGDLARESEVDGQVNFFTVDDDPSEKVLKVNGISALDGEPPEFAPDPQVVTDPVWPIDLLLKGEGGSAAVQFDVQPSGSVSEIKVKEASHPEFGQAVAAALETWYFSRPRTDPPGMAVTLLKKTEFKAVPLDASDEDNPWIRLVLALRRGQIGSAKGLDEKITPIYRVQPQYPQSLVANGSPKGHADIEFVIDREGRARLPRIVSATADEFGWSAATAVAQWVFKAPRRGGQPVDVKVRIPFEFAAPAH
jgi:TonB family protein